MRIPTDTVVLVADGEKALFLRNKGDSEYLNLVVDGKETHQNPPTDEQGTDRPGKKADDMGHHTAMEETDWHRLEKERFATQITEMLFEQLGKKRFERLVIAAPPQTLGELRKHMHKTVASLIIGEVHKDLTRLPVYEIEAHLKKEA